MQPLRYKILEKTQDRWEDAPGRDANQKLETNGKQMRGLEEEA